MAQSYYPFSNSPLLTNEQWSKIARNWLNTGVVKGVLNELQVYADSTGMQVKVKSGASGMKGHYFESDAQETLPIGSADASNPRIDRLIIRLDWVAETIQLAVLQGTAATSPVAPALTQNTSRWEISLSQVRVNAGVTTIAASNVTDERNFANIEVQGDGERIEFVELSFSSDGTKDQLTASGTFAKAFASAPTIIPANLTQVVSYADRIIYPYIYSITTTGFSVVIKTSYTGVEIPKFGIGTVKMKFKAIGK